MEVTSSTERVLSEFHRERLISVPEAARFKGISADTFRRHYRRLIRKISPRRVGVRVGDLIDSD